MFDFSPLCIFKYALKYDDNDDDDEDNDDDDEDYDDVPYKGREEKGMILERGEHHHHHRVAVVVIVLTIRIMQVSLGAGPRGGERGQGLARPLSLSYLPSEVINISSLSLSLFYKYFFLFF